MKSTRSVYELLSIVENIEGWLSNYEQFALLHLPSMVDHIPGDIVEIGSYKGKSTIALALGSSLLSTRKRPIYAIDPFVNPYVSFYDPYFDSFWANVKYHGLENFVIPIKKFSTQAYGDCPKSIAAIFIDSDHEYSSVKHDIISYTPRVLKEGLIVFHDYSDQYPGVLKAVDELCDNEGFKPIIIYDNLILVRKL